MTNPNDVVRLLAQAQSEERAALTAVAAIREVAGLLEQRLSGDALEAAAEALATVASKYAKRGAALQPLTAAFEAMSGNARDRAVALASASREAAGARPGQPVPPAGNGPERPAQPPDAPVSESAPEPASNGALDGQR